MGKNVIQLFFELRYTYCMLTDTSLITQNVNIIKLVI